MDALQSPFSAYLAEKYAALKADTPEDGRRKRKMKLVREFWDLPREEKEKLEQIASDAANQAILAAALETVNGDDDEFDDITPGAGIIVRADYSNDQAWEGFVSALKEAEKDLITLDENDEMAEDTSGEPSAGGPDAEADSESDSEDEGMDADESGASSNPSTSIFMVVAPLNSSGIRTRLTGISNLTALRLYNDVDVVRAPKLPLGTQRIKPSNRLIDHDGFLEIYTGDLVWIYDAQSNADRSVRLVNQKSESYGSATGDSWRAKVSFLPELQLNLVSGAMKIDFGGLDRWDHTERQRNLAEAALPP